MSFSATENDILKAANDRLAERKVKDKTLLDSLDSMGADENQIANTLKTMGITGVKDVVDACPIANYLCGLYPNQYVSVGPYTTYIAKDRYSTPIASVRNPEKIKQFINKFDNGEWPELCKDKITAPSA